MPVERVHETLAALARAGVDAWCMGGWGVDALLGRQSRRHRDLDVIVDRQAVGAAVDALKRVGYRAWYELTAPAGAWYQPELATDRDEERQIAMRDDAYRAVELHVLDVARSGLEPATGTIGGRPVRCLSLASLRQVYATYRRQHGREHPNWTLLRRAEEARTLTRAPQAR
jgi:lincosamide nucleotidyltransferase A/C/D/E